MFKFAKCDMSIQWFISPVQYTFWTDSSQFFHKDVLFCRKTPQHRTRGLWAPLILKWKDAFCLRMVVNLREFTLEPMSLFQEKLVILQFCLSGGSISHFLKLYFDLCLWLWLCWQLPGFINVKYKKSICILSQHDRILL